jgi:uncharacterized membrane protein YhhN
VAVVLTVWGLSAATAITGALCIRGKYTQSRWVVYVFKPLTTGLIFAMALTAGASESLYGRLVAVAIIFSLGGDVFLMLPKDHFIHGLASFLVAHLVLIGAFTLEWPGVTWWLLVLVAIPALGMRMVLAPHLGRMTVPVTVYITVIGTMVWFGVERWLAMGSVSGILAAVGAMLFMFSDSILALDRFRAEFRSADLIVLSTYYLSLWLFALSVRPGLM